MNYQKNDLIWVETDKEKYFQFDDTEKLRPKNNYCGPAKVRIVVPFSDKINLFFVVIPTEIETISDEKRNILMICEKEITEKC